MTAGNVHESFKEMGLWPLRFDFADRFRTASDARREHADGIEKETDVSWGSFDVRQAAK